MPTIANDHADFVITSLTHDVEANTTQVEFEIHFPPRRSTVWDESKEGGDDMTAEKPPVRITKQRAQAFLESADRGIDEQIKDLKEEFGLVLTRDGVISHDNENFTLLVADAEGRAAQKIDRIARAIDTLAIFRRRYG